MSGTGGGDPGLDWRIPTGGLPPQGEPCNIVEQTPLNSPNRGVLAQLQPNSVLRVEFRAGPPPQLLAVTDAGDVAGSITSPSMIRIIECIQSGSSYQAVVLEIRGGMCQVQVRLT